MIETKTIVLKCGVGVEYLKSIRGNNEPKSQSWRLEELGLERELMRNVAKLKLQYFRQVVTGSAGELSLAVLEAMIDEIRYQ